MKRLLAGLILCFFTSVIIQTSILAQANESKSYKLLATRKTSTMEKEMNEAAQAGYRFEGVSGGGTAFGGSEVVVIMSKSGNGEGERYRFQYKLLATSKTSTMQKEMQEAGDAGFEYKGQIVFETAFGGEEVVVILEHDKKLPIKKYGYKLLATSKTSTMQKELGQAGEAGYSFVGITVGKTAFGGNEVVVILRREIQAK
jgi:hypothetical protein